MASAARAVGMIGVCVDAVAEVSTHRISSLPAVLPSTSVDIAPSTLSLCWARNAGPANTRAATEITANTATSSTVEVTAARPGVLARSLVSSVTLTAQSQPQYTNTASRNEIARPRNEPVHRLHHAAARRPAAGSA